MAGVETDLMYPCKWEEWEMLCDIISVSDKVGTLKAGIQLNSRYGWKASLPIFMGHLRYGDEGWLLYKSCSDKDR